MPELIEVEMYRADVDGLVGGTVQSVRLNDRRFARPKGAEPAQFEVLVGAQLTETRLHGKLLLATFGKPDAVLGLRFGMTGRLLVDGRSSIEQLEYASGRNEPKWDRFEIEISGQRVVVRDQRCLGSVELDPDLSKLAPDARRVSPDILREAFSGRSKAVKAALLDQSIIAGLGNLLADEALWSAGIAPGRPVDELSDVQLSDLSRHIVETIKRLTTTGGSNTGRTFDFRHEGALCPRCSGGMRSDRIGGRTSWWCSRHQS